jgi:hypothetical protein
MKRFRLLGVALLALLALGAFASASASALVLPGFLTHQESFTGKSTGAEPELELSSGAKVKCKTAPSEGTGEAGSDSLGAFHIHFTGCEQTALKHECHSTGDANGVILVLGIWHLVYSSVSPLVVANLFLVEHFHFECSALASILVLGSVLCPVVDNGTSHATWVFNCKQAKGVQEQKTYWNDAGTEVTSGLKCSVGEGAEAECGEQAAGEVTFNESVSIENL